MSEKKKIPIKYRKERVILSDILPFETPITFSNRHFYNFLISHNIELEDGKVSWNKDDLVVESTIKLLFGLNNEANPTYASIIFKTQDDLENALNRTESEAFFQLDPALRKVTLPEVSQTNSLSQHLLSKTQYSKNDNEFTFSKIDEYNSFVTDLYKIKTDVIINKEKKQITVRKDSNNFKVLAANPKEFLQLTFYTKCNNSLRKRPFGYKIAHKETDFRELSIIHPISQLAMVEFYNKYRNTILYYSGISTYSIRKPFKVARMLYHKDKTHFDKLSNNHEHEAIEEQGKEYESLKTYFAYKNYSNIHKFYESYKYHRCEKKYSQLFKFDISKCFDSIYTHSIAWALYNKEIIKSNIKKSDRTFAARFDTIMSGLNHGETNGIIIGPEFSRIFAEIILQEIDRRTESKLRDKCGILHKRDYEMFRYVDDYFLFFNDESQKEIILSHVKLSLKDFGMYLNDSKIKLYQKPIITEITIAKSRISDLFNKHISVKKENGLNSTVNLIDNEKKEDEKYSLYISSNRVITKFKTIIKETQVEYKDILNYSLAVIDRKVLSLIREFHKVSNKKESERGFIRSILEILDITFFIYSVSPRINSTIKLCMVLSKVIKYIRVSKTFSFDNTHLVLKKIYDDISLILKNTKNTDHTPVETLYLLVALRELGREYRLDLNALRKYFVIEEGYESLDKLNYFSIIVLLFYIGDKVRYKSLKEDIERQVILRFDNHQYISESSEMIFLFFDIITCPYVDIKTKKKLLFVMGIKEDNLQAKIINQRKYWFTKWSNFKFEKELDAKKSQEVY